MEQPPASTPAADVVRRRAVPVLVAMAVVVVVAGSAFLLGRGSSADGDEGGVGSTTVTTEVSSLTASGVYAVVAPSMVVVIGDDETVGSGTVVNADGTVLTALHVVADAASIELVFADGTRSPASIASSDPATDSAVLTPSTLPEIVVPAVLGGGIDVGSTVVAVGHPFGLVNSLSEGVVSGLGRSATADDGQVLSDLIQFDAAVNPGNSGGPLLDDRGVVVGIVTALANPSDDAAFIGIGFAVPIFSAVGGGGGGTPVPQ